MPGILCKSVTNSSFIGLFLSTIHRQQLILVHMLTTWLSFTNFFQYTHCSILTHEIPLDLVPEKHEGILLHLEPIQTVVLGEDE